MKHHEKGVYIMWELALKIAFVLFQIEQTIFGLSPGDSVPLPDLVTKIGAGHFKISGSITRES